MQQNAYFHQNLLLALVLFFAALHWLLGFSFNQQMLFFLAITLSIGMLHGMLDIVLLQYDFIEKKLSTNFAASGLLYALFAIGCVSVLLALPFLTIPILLVISVWHFGEKQRQQLIEKTCPIVRILIGGAAVAMPYLVAQPALQQLLGALNLTADALKMALFAWQFISLFWLMTVILVALAALFKIHHWLNKIQWLELAIVALAFVLLPPLVAFSLYFGGYHALRHIRDVLQTSQTIKNQPFKNQFKYIALIALASACLLAGVAAYLANNSFALTANISASQLFHATFILLVALTLPHAFLITLWRKSLHHKSL
jgi:Brp/Blh family beta-carotene 15,15'-monooxygenase